MFSTMSAWTVILLLTENPVPKNHSSAVTSTSTQPLLRGTG